MTDIYVISGFLGAGKTTLIKKLLKDAFADKKVVLIENEFGEIGIDGGFLKEAGIEITEMNSGCICCSLVGDFGKALAKVLTEYAPDYIIIEPSGVGKLSDVIKAIEDVAKENPNISIGSAVTVADASKCKLYMKNFGEFFNNQIEFAQTIILSRTQNVSEEKLQACVSLIREHNEKADLVTTPWDLLTAEQLLSVIEKKTSFSEDLENELKEELHAHHHHEDGEECHCHEHHHEHEHHHHEDGEECHCHEHHHEHEHHHHEDGEECHCHEHHHEHEHHHHEDDEECHCHEHHHEHEHHHHEDGEECHCHEHHHEHEHHHHEDGEECHCHEHHHEHEHHHHHADEVFTSWGRETIHAYTEDEISSILEVLDDADKYGIVLRAKGIVAGKNGEWIHFDYVPQERNVRLGAAEYTGRICVIGSKLDESALEELFCLN